MAARLSLLSRTRRLRVWAALALAAFVAVIVVPVVAIPAAPSYASSGTRLIGLFELAPGRCSAGSISGTYLRMILPSGTNNGPYMANADSPCSDQSFTPLGPGSDGGLSTAGYQSPPNPPFASDGNARAGRITAPAKYYGTNFATGTSPVDPQTGVHVPVPVVTLNGTTLSADLRAFSVTWNNQYFNQGAPKPNGSTPGNTRLATGTYDPSSGRFTLTWSSQVIGGPFDKFTGQWHLAGTFVPASRASTAVQGSTTQTRTVPGVPTQVARSGPTSTKAAGTPASSKVRGVAPAVAAASGPVTLSSATVTKPVWSVSKPVILVAIVIALFGIVALLLLRVAERRGSKGTP